MIVFPNRPWRTAALTALIAAGPAALAEVTVTLAPPPAALEPGRTYWIRPEVAGTEDPRCWWTLCEDGVRVGTREGVCLVPAKNGGATLTVAAGRSGRDLVLRVTSRQDPDGFASVRLQVAAQAEPGGAATETKDRLVSPIPAGETKGGGPVPWVQVAADAVEPERRDATAAPEPGPEPWVWRTRFALTEAHSRRIWPSSPHKVPGKITSFAWDARAAKPSILALCRDHNDFVPPHHAVVRIAIDGELTVLATTDPKGSGPGGPWRHAQSIKATHLAVRANGDAVVADWGNGVIWQIADGTRPRIIAGSAALDPRGLLDEAGKPRRRAQFTGDQHPDGRPLLATEADLGPPAGVAVTAADEVIFSDWDCHQLRKITSGGTLVTLAGDGTRDWFSGKNDLTQRHPARAGSLPYPSEVATTADGRILVLTGTMSEGILVLHQDGSIATLAGAPKGSNAVAPCGDGGVRVKEYKSTASGSCYRILKVPLDADPVQLVGPATSSETHALTMAPASAGGFHYITVMAPVPDGGTLFLSEGVMYYLGPGKGEASLAGLVQEAVSDGGRHEAIVRCLRNWVENPKDQYRTGVLNTYFCGPPPLPPAVLRNVLGGFLQDPVGLAIRARFALDAIQDLTGGSQGRISTETKETKGTGGSTQPPPSSLKHQRL